MSGLLALGVVVIAALGLVIAHQADAKTQQPVAIWVRVGTALILTSIVIAFAGLTTGTPAQVPVGILATLLIGVPVVHAAARRAIGWSSFIEIAISALFLAWVKPARALASTLCGVAGLGVAAWLSGQDEPLAVLAGCLVVLAPARWHVRNAYRRESARTGIERALAGVMVGGLEWESDEADLRGAPVRVRFDADARPVSVTHPLPPRWDTSSTEKLEEEIQKRLEVWGYWLVQIDPSKRGAVAQNVDPLPTRIDYAGETASERGEVVLGMARLSRVAAKTLGRVYGEVCAFIWDARVSPHGIVVGTTGGGKSSVFRVIVTSWCRGRRRRAILLDPKTTEFGLFRGRRGVMVVADTVESMTAVLRQVEEERVRRAALCKTHGVTAVWLLPKALRPASWLIVVDEIVDYLATSAAQTDRAQAENTLRAEAQDLINRIDALARVGDIHVLLAGQRLDRKIVDGRIQNNSPLRILLGVSEAGSTERHMVGLQEVEPETAVPGRGVAKSVRMPESEVQFTYLEEDDLDLWLPRDSTAEREWLDLTRPSRAMGHDHNDITETTTELPSDGQLPHKKTSSDSDAFAHQGPNGSLESPSVNEGARPHEEYDASPPIAIDLSFFDDEGRG